MVEMVMREQTALRQRVAREVSFNLRGGNDSRAATKRTANLDCTQRAKQAFASEMYPSASSTWSTCSGRHRDCMRSTKRLRTCKSCALQRLDQAPMGRTYSTAFIRYVEYLSPQLPADDGQIQLEVDGPLASRSL